jgi:mono/diheme cytochrome c family protein
MMWLKTCIVSLVWTISSSPGAYSQTVAPAGSADGDGHVLYSTHCASCHGTGGHGDGPVAASLRRRPADLTQLAAKNGGTFPSAKAHRIVDGRDVGAHGNAEMPVWGDAFRRRGLSDEQSKARIEAIVGYLESVQARGAN